MQHYIYKGWKLLSACNQFSSACNSSCNYISKALKMSSFFSIHSYIVSISLNPNSQDNKGSCLILLDFDCSVTMVMELRSEQTFNRAWNRCHSLRVTENYRLIYTAAMVIWPHHVGYYFQSLSFSKISTPIPCPVDRDDIVDLTCM